MYSYRDRIKAVQLYLKLGKRLGATIRQWGYKYLADAGHFGKVMIDLTT